MKQKISRFFLDYLRILAKIQIAKVNTIQRLKGQTLTIIGITGSAGKSSCLLAVEAVLKNNFTVKTNNLSNSESGIPLNILGIKPSTYSPLDWLSVALSAPRKLLTNWQSYQIYVAEMGIDEPDEPKNMSYLLKIIRPSIGIFLNVNPVHSLQFDKTVDSHLTGTARLQKILSHIASEKAKLITSLPANGTAIINSLDPLVGETTGAIIAPTLAVGRDVNIISTQTTPFFQCLYRYQNQKYTLSLPSYVLPEIYSITLAAALLAGVALGLDFQSAVDNLAANLTLPPSRSTLMNGIKKSRIIDSSYNSSLTATIAMLKLLAGFASPKIAILGDLREVGQQSKIVHQQIYRAALESADTIISVGPETQKYFGAKSQKFLYWWQALDYLKSQPKLIQNSTILIKGSQNTIYLEEIVKNLLADPSDVSKICRQSPYWQKLKNQFHQQNS